MADNSLRMCGIAGCVALSEPDLAQSVTRVMTDALVRRGPNGEGIATWPGVALGHRRLAIIDLSEAGRQPMLSEDGNIGLVFNGCIYNFLELRPELERLGYRFRSRCDTEVLLAGYQHWGIDKLVARLRGMFAFAVWDQNRRKLFLVRDRLGIKPLHYSDSGNRLTFASTAAALRATGAVNTEIDPQAVLEYLEFGFVTDSRSVYRHVSKVPPATILEWSPKGGITTRCYWDLPRTGEGPRISFEEALEETEKRIIDCTRLRLVSDVPIAALLSGGIDSALVCWALARLNANVRTFTISAPGDPSDETEAAQATARTLGIHHEALVIDRSESDPVGELVDAFSEPFGAQSAMGMLRLSRTIKSLATVLLTGDGGDDVFLGYPFFLHAWQAQQWAARMPGFAPDLWQRLRRIVPGTGPWKRLHSFASYTMGGLGAYNRVRTGLPYFQERSLLGERLQDLRLPQRDMPPSLDSARHLLDEVFRYHRQTQFTSEFMPKVDSSTMYYGVESRSPFLDHTLWEFAAGLPAEIHFQGGRLKALLREIVRRRIGPSTASRPKQGFRVPAEKWLAGPWRAYLDQLLSGTLVEREGYIQGGALRTEIDRAIAAGGASEQLWFVLVLERWLQSQQSSVPSLSAR
jgi:asparagine synthase (glutamine-hydrolysing)